MPDEDRLRGLPGGKISVLPGAELLTCERCQEPYYARAPHPPEECIDHLRARLYTLDRERRRAWKEAGHLATIATDLRTYWPKKRRQPFPGDTLEYRGERIASLSYRLAALHEDLDPRTPEQKAEHERWVAEYEAEREALKKLKRVWFVRARRGLYHLVDGDDEAPRWKKSLCGRLKSDDWSGMEMHVRPTPKAKPPGDLCGPCTRHDYPTRKKYL